MQGDSMKQTRTAIAVAALALLAGSWEPIAGQGRKDDKADVQFQAALHAEMVEGDLEGAIRQYKKVIADHEKSNKTVTAKALVQLGQSYEKLGSSESRKMYERVLREFADQADAVRQARARLGRHQASDSDLTARQIWSGKGVDIEGQPSPDGRYLTFVDWRKKGNLAIRDLNAGTERLLTQDAGEQFAYWGAVFSPDGRQIAYQWCCDQIRIINTDGSRGRVLLRDKNAYPMQPAAWSPDSKYIAALIGRTSDKVNRIALISVTDGSVTPLKTVGWAYPAIGDFSPDGRFLVYSLGGTKTANGGVFAIAVDGSREIPLVEGPSGFKAPAWTPDGRSVVFPSNRSGAPA